MDYVYPQYDIVWIALDGNNQVGALITAGFGPIPTQLLINEDSDLYDTEANILNLPVVGTPRLLVAVKDPRSYLSLGKRGLYVYDWPPPRWLSSDPSLVCEHDHDYSLVTTPEAPITAEALPQNLKDTASKVQFRDISFKDTAAINVRRRFACVEFH